MYNKIKFLSITIPQGKLVSTVTWDEKKYKEVLIYLKETKVPLEILPINGDYYQLDIMIDKLSIDDLLYCLSAIYENSNFPNPTKLWNRQFNKE